MQFIGRLDNALLSGSEQVYLPRIGSAWRGTSTVAVWDPTQADVPALSPGLAGIVIYGYAFGNSSKGFICYEASHNFMTGNTSEDVDAARVYGNFLLYSGITEPAQDHRQCSHQDALRLRGDGERQRDHGHGHASFHLQMDQLLRRHIRQSQLPLAPHSPPPQ